MSQWYSNAGTETFAFATRNTCDAKSSFCRLVGNPGPAGRYCGGMLSTLPGLAILLREVRVKLILYRGIAMSLG